MLVRSQNERTCQFSSEEFYDFLKKKERSVMVVKTHEGCIFLVVKVYMCCESTMVVLAACSEKEKSRSTFVASRRNGPKSTILIQGDSKRYRIRSIIGHGFTKVLVA